MPRFDYPCPDCHTSSSLHDAGCRFEGRTWQELERAYVDQLAVLAAGARDEDDLRDAVPDWDGLREQALSHLRRTGRVQPDTNGRLELLTAEQYREQVSEPTAEPMRTIYRRGSYPGCHDNAVFAMVAWYEMVGLTWAETREKVIEWLEESGTWSRGGFEEISPAELVDKKRHVYEAGYGWKEKAQAAKRVIERHT
ncbi:MAG: hypothetical protein V5A38_04835 [Halolamina sp.]|uniref:DUF7474 family protein n=1 Tax=Halolamina sp. TaxID=1940283 RepID=UPI002FC2FC44